MDITLSKQNCMVISQFLSDKANPPQKYPDVTSYRAVLRVRKQLEQSIQNYSQVFQDLVTQDRDALKAAQEKLKAWEDELTKQDKAPSAQAKDEFAKPLQAEFNKVREELQAKAVEHEKANGSVMITVDLQGKYPQKDWKVVKKFFEENGQNFPMFQVGDKLEEIAQIFDNT